MKCENFSSKIFHWLENSEKNLKNIKKIPTGLEIAKNSEIFLMTPTKWGNTRGRRGRLI
jgi:hypothetical protein